jgi:hypothetical protein
MFSHDATSLDLLRGREGQGSLDGAQDGGGFSRLSQGQICSRLEGLALAFGAIRRRRMLFHDISSKKTDRQLAAFDRFGERRASG